MAMPGKSWIVQDGGPTRRGVDSSGAQCPVRGSLSSPGGSPGQRPHSSPSRPDLLPELQGHQLPWLESALPVLHGVQVGHRQGGTSLALRCPRRHWGRGLPGGAQRTWGAVLMPSEAPPRTMRQANTPQNTGAGVQSFLTASPATQPVSPSHRGDRAGPTQHLCGGEGRQEEFAGTFPPLQLLLSLCHNCHPAPPTGLLARPAGSEGVCSTRLWQRRC